jgi:TPP-dependent pyruvate/acetoin dehydrogenase alpha subunit
LRDPIKVFKAYLESKNLISERDMGFMDSQIDKEIFDAITFAENGTLGPIDNLLKYVYASEVIL